MRDATLDPAVLREAANWYLRLQMEPATAADRADWQRWLQLSPSHQQAWERVERMQSLMASAPAQARRALQAPVRRRRLGIAAAAAFAVFTAAMLVERFALRSAPMVLATGSGERRAWKLPDGSLLVLGAASRVTVDFSRSERLLRLQEGFLQLTTGHHPDYVAVPMRVVARDGAVQPLGTQFSLEQGEHWSVLAVQEDAVLLTTTVRPGGKLGMESLRVTGRHRVRFDAQGAGPVEVATAADDAWTRGRLVVLDMPLAEFAAVLSRHSGRSVLCDEAVATVRVSGTYSVDEVGRSLSNLAASFNLRLVTTSTGFRLSR